MKKTLFALAALIMLAACGNKPSTATSAPDGDETSVVAFEVARNYFFKNNQQIPASPKITSAEAFNQLFGMATTMGEDGKPTAIDFTKQFVLAVVLPVTNLATEINPVKVEARGDSLFYTYDVTTGEIQSYNIQPLSIIILDKQYEDKTVVLVNGRETTYFPAIDRYLTSQIGSQYAKGEHCVPFHSIVAVDERNDDDILVWGDFWVFNYNQVGDTLKCVSGGSHPGLMHLRLTDGGYEVTAFEQVEDGSNNLPSAKKIFGDKYDAFQAINSDEQRREQLRADVLATYVKQHNLPVTLYQDFGWPAKKLAK
ncbi:MAG: hypothetical protein IKW98_05790 [Prevotella sp.]|nr:hypothetical protein [Prevotella sp.]